MRREIRLGGDDGNCGESEDRDKGAGFQMGESDFDSLSGGLYSLHLPQGKASGTVRAYPLGNCMIVYGSWEVLSFATGSCSGAKWNKVISPQ
jgi:hypothetical protein